jgi:uncharacterized protein YbcC (UPF0753/DUF2309 family)
MFRQRFIFNIIGKKDLVDKASLEIKTIINELTNEPVSIIMEKKDRVLDKHTTKYVVNKYYLENEEKDVNEVVELSRHIRNATRDTVHPWNLHVESVDSLYVSDFMKSCSQINCVYPMNALENIKKDKIQVFLH